MVKRDESSNQVVLTNYDYNAKPFGKGYSFIVRTRQPTGGDILSGDALDLNNSINILKPLSENVVDTFFIAGQVNASLNLTCLQ